MSGSVCEQRARSLAGSLHTALRSDGFRKRGVWLRRSARGEPLGVAYVLGVQLSQRNRGNDCSCYVNVGAGLVGLPGLPLDTERMRPRDCLWQERIGQHWALTEPVSELAETIAEQAQPWFAKWASAQAMLDPFDDRDLSTLGSWVGQIDQVCAAWAALGQPDRARAGLEAKRAWWAEHRPNADPSSIDDLARALGLTGESEF